MTDYIDALVNSQRQILIITADLERTSRSLDDAITRGLASGYLQLGSKGVLVSLGERFEGASFVAITSTQAQKQLVSHLAAVGRDYLRVIVEWDRSGGTRRMWPHNKAVRNRSLP